MMLWKVLAGAVAVLLLTTALLFMQLKSATAAAAKLETERDQIAQTAADLNTQIEQMLAEAERKNELLADNRRKIAKIIQDNGRLKGKINAVLRETEDACAGLAVPPDAIRLLDQPVHEDEGGVRVPNPESSGADAGAHPTG